MAEKKKRKEEKTVERWDGCIDNRRRGKIISTPEGDKLIAQRAENGPARNGRKGE
jgi:hypothetical protein